MQDKQIDTTSQPTQQDKKQTEATKLLDQAKDLKANKKSEDALKLLDKALETINKEEELQTLGEIYENYKLIYCEQTNLKEALKQAQLCLEIMTKLDNKEKISDNMHDIAFIYAGLNDHVTAGNKFEEALEYTLKNFDENHANVALIYEHGAQSKAIEKIFDEAIEYGEKSYKLRLKNKGENSKELISSCMTLWNIHQSLQQINEGLPYYVKFLDLVTEGANDDENKIEGLNDYAISYNKAGNYYLQANNAKDALNCFNRAYDLFLISKEGNKECVEVLDSIFNKGKAYYFQQNYDEALKILEDSSKSFSKHFPQGNQRIAGCYDMMATIYFKINKFDEALTHYDKALRAFIDLSQNPPETYMKLAFTLLKKGQPDKLLSTLKTYMNLNKEKHGSDSINFIDSLQYVADFCNNNNQFTEAVETYQEIISIYESKGERFEIALANTYRKLGFSYAALQKKTESVEVFIKSADLQAKNVEKNDPTIKPSELVFTYNALAQGILSEGDAQLAKDLVEKAQKIGTKYCKPEDSSYIKSLYLNAACLQKLKKVDDAMKAYNDYLAIDSQFLDPKDHVSAYQNLCVLYTIKSNFDKAVEQQELAIKICKQRQNEESEIGLCYNQLGSLYFKFNRNQEAVDHFKIALKSFEKNPEKNSFIISQTFNHIGYSYLKLDLKDQAEEFFNKCLEIRTLNQDRDQVSLARSHHDFGLLYTAKQEHEKAISHHKKCIEIMEKALGEGDEDVIAEYYSLKSCYEIMDDNEKAIEVLKIILEIRVKNKTNDIHEFIGIYENLAICYGKLGNEDTMVYYDKRVEDLKAGLNQDDGQEEKKDDTDESDEDDLIAEQKREEEMKAAAALLAKKEEAEKEAKKEQEGEGEGDANKKEE